MRGRHSRRNPAPPLATGRLTPMIAGQPDPAMHKKLQGIAEGLRAHYGDPVSEARKASAVPPQPAGEATSAGRAVAKPGTPPVVPRGSDGVPGPDSSPSLPPGRQEGGEGEVEPSRSGRAQEPAPGTGASGVQAWKDAIAANNRARRNRRGKRPGPQITGVRIPPPGGTG